MRPEHLKHLFGTIEAKSLDDLPYDPNCPIPKGARIEKIREESPGGELHPIGSRGYTYGGFMKNGIDAYFVKWDAQMKLKVAGADTTLIAVMGWKIKEIPKKKKAK